MTTRRAIPWFLSDTGRTFSFGAITSFAIGATVVKFSPHTFFLYKYKEFVHYYRNSQPVPLSSELQVLVEKCMNILTLSDVHKKLVQPFSVFGYDLFHAGSIKSKYGITVGIPVNFTYKSLADIEKDDIMVNQKKIDWTSENGKKLADAIILPEKVQQFAICREILATQNFKVHLDSVYPFISIFFAYRMSQFINQKRNLYAAPTPIRGIVYTLVGLFSTGVYFFLKDFTEVYYETEVDKQLCDLGPEFIESGVILYDKLLKRNQALRELMGDEGERKYSKLGNENFFIRQPRMALVHRKQYFENRLKEANEGDNKSTT